MRKVDEQMRRTDARGRNALSVRIELQADCYAGVWGYYAQKRNKLEPGDLEEGFRAASAVGDDSIQKRAQGYVVPESFTHGSSEQRLRWYPDRVGNGRHAPLQHTRIVTARGLLPLANFALPSPFSAPIMVAEIGHP